MKRIIIACVGGLSTSILAERLIDATLNKGYTAAVNIIQSPKEYDAFNEDVDMAFFITGASAFSQDHLIQTHQDADLILLAPQIKYLIPSIERSLSEIGVNIPVEPIELSVFARCNGVALLEMIERLS